MPLLWIGFIAIILTLLALDLGVLQRKDHVPSIREAAVFTAIWVSLGLLFSVAVYFIYEHGLMGAKVGDGPALRGFDAALLYLTGFLLEECLSIDNLFVMVLIFNRHRIPTAYQHRVLYWGILGALVMRAGMILGGVWLIERFAWLMYVFGAYLAYAGVQALRHEEEAEPDDAPAAPRLSLVMPVTKGPVASPHFFQRIDGKLHATPLFVALISVELADVVFALDSVPAVLTITTDPFIVFTSNIFAILGLRSLYFVLAAMMDKFRHLKYALAAILVFIGGKMLLHDYVHVPIGASLAVILLSISAAVGWSWRSSPTPSSADAN